MEVLRFRIRQYRLRVMRFGNGEVEVLARFGDLIEVKGGQEGAILPMSATTINFGNFGREPDTRTRGTTFPSSSSP